MEPSRLVELVMSVDEAQACEETTRGDIRRVVPREKRSDPNDVECIVDGTGRCFERVTLFPMTGRDMHTQFGNAWMFPAWAETAAPDVLASGEEEDRPILNAVASLCLNLALKTSTDLLLREPSNRNKPSYRRIAPKHAREGNVGFVPPTETEAR